MRSRKWLLAAAALAATLAGCATGPYYDDPYYRNYGYSDEYRPAPPPGYYGPSYYGPGYYVAPPAVSLGLGFSYSDHHHH